MAFPPDSDIMNDPAFDPNVAPHDGGSDNNEPDYCRVCRSEGSEEEPLYHPCKCSGSIKFVHEECLMEWLQHSQKKYCELCKTPFTFTKVYDPEMPNRIPTPLFLKRLAHHLLQNTIMWARAALVAAVWLGWLPFIVRWMWRGWFWVSDGGWWLLHASARAATASAVAQAASETSSVASATATSSPAGKSLLGFLASPALSPRMSPVNGGPVVLNATAPMNQTQVAYYSDGIFFDTNPFSTLTSSPFVNRAIVDILEGQLLTALIVISFILVFLIREWVVQQQPALAGDEAAPVAPAADVPVPEEPAVAEVAEVDDPVPAGPINLDGDAGHQPAERRPRVIAQPRRRRNFTAENAENNAGEASVTVDTQLPQENESLENSATFSFGDRIQRPQPTRENTAQVTNVRRDMEENAVSTPSGFNFHARSEDFRFGNPSPTLPVFGSNSQPREATGGPSQDLWDKSAEELEVIDTGRVVHEDERSNSAPIGASPWAPQRRSDSQSRGSGSGPHIFDDAEEVSKNDAELSASGTNYWGTTGTFDKIFGSEDKGKGREDEPEKEVPSDTDFERQDEVESVSKGKEKASLVHENEPLTERRRAEMDVWQYRDKDSETDSESTKSEISQGVGPSDWSTTAQAGDTPARTDTPIATHTAPTPNEEHIEDAAAVPQPRRAPNAVEVQVLLQMAQERGIPEAAVRNALDDFARGPAALEALVNPPPRDAPARQAGGLWGWFVGNQDAEENGAEEPAAGAEDAAPAAPPVIPDEDQQAIIDEDAADDFEGIMELVGMRGPLVGLITNAGICVVLITATVAVGVAFPYVTGKTVMMILAHPIVFFVHLPYLAITFVAEFIVDSATCLAFSLLLWINQVANLLLKPFSFIPGLSTITNSPAATNFLRKWAIDGQTRVFEKFISLESTYLSMRKYPSSAVPPLSLVARESWSNITVWFAWVSDKIGLGGMLGGSAAVVAEKAEAGGATLLKPVAILTDTLSKAFSSASPTNGTSAGPTIAVGIVDSPSQQLATPYALYRWSAWDRVGVVLLGYAFFTVCGAIFLRTRRRAPIGSVERLVVDFLEQCGGVMKVVLIIGIEMVIFPLYCGILLDAAMLPLFEDASILSRINFSLGFPLTSIFVHWFVGTCYMFHFALFVSMCRKIMRSGVLYFIRDPDDPTFHPVRDVLDRPVVTQLRKIAFSGLIYGILVVVCLGGVVYLLSVATRSVLPIHWSSNEPVLEFPIDLLFYNFLIPVAVKFFKPADGLQRMYEWWFKKCARWLRLTSFMFGERAPEEEGRRRKSYNRGAWRLDGQPIVQEPAADENPGTERAEGQNEETGESPEPHAATQTDKQTGEQAATDPEDEFELDGRFVRAPASDSVRRPKGQAVFIPVNGNNQRTDGEDDPEDSPFGPNSDDYKMVYIPPWFRIRVGIVVLSIWMFAAITGVGVTIGPLMLGRMILQTVVPKEIRLNDIYAFSLGIYIVGGFVYAVAMFPTVKHYFQSLFASTQDDSQTTSRWVAIRDWTVRAARVSYVFASFAIVLPTLVALMIEFYLIIPIHTYFSPEDEQHVIHFIQDWTLGVIYVKMMGRMVLLDRDSPWARALRGVVARGYLDPDVKLATKTFIAPAASFMLAALLLPLFVGYIAVKVFLYNASSTTISQTYRYAYPAVFLVALAIVSVYGLHLLAERWRSSVKDEVYLIGERLHNHGEELPPPTPSARRERGEDSSMEDFDDDVVVQG